MKPILLEFCGVNCFDKKQTIDFDRLSKSGIFGIFGPTGSGKSTILDAMTLALFGEIERSKGKGDFVNTNTGKAEVLFVFESGKQYLVERKYTIKKSGILDAVAILKSGDRIIAEGVRDTDAAIKKITGLTMDDFSKCVALPQGKFANFLQAKPAERTALVGNLFGLDQYGDELLHKANSKKAFLLQELSFLDKQIADLGTNLFEEIKDIEEQIELDKSQIEQIDSNLQQLQKQKNVADLQQERLKKQTALQKRQTQLEEQKPEIEKLEQALEKHKIVSIHEVNCKRLAKLVAREKELAPQIAEIQKSLSLAKIDLDSAKREYESAQKRAQTVANSDDEIASLSALAQKEEENKKLLEQILNDQAKEQSNDDLLSASTALVDDQTVILKKTENQIAFLESEISQKQKQVFELGEMQKSSAIEAKKQVLLQVLKELEQNFDAAQESSTAHKAAISANSKLAAVEQAKIDDILFKLNLKEDIENVCLVFGDKVKKMQNAKEQLDWLDAEKTQIASQKQSVVLKNNFDSAEAETCKASVAKLESQLQLAKEELRSLESERDHALLDNAESTVASETVLGTTCPICGNVANQIYPPKNTAISNINHSISLTKKQIEQLEAEKNANIIKKATLEQKIDSRLEALKEFEQKEKLLDEKSNKVLIAFVDIGINAKANFLNLLETTQNQLVALADAKTKIGKLQQQIKQILSQNGEHGTNLLRDNQTQEKLANYIEQVQKALAENQFQIIASDSLSPSQIGEQLEDAQSRLDKLTKELKDQLDKKTTCASIVAAEQEKQSFLTGENKQICERIELAKAKIEQTKDEIDSAKRGYLSVADKIQKLKSAKDSILKENAAAAQKVEQAVSTLFALQPKFAALEKEKETLSDEISTLSIVLVPVAKKLQTTPDQLQDLKLEDASFVENKILAFKNDVHATNAALNDLGEIGEVVQSPDDEIDKLKLVLSEKQKQFGINTEKLCTLKKNAEKLSALQSEKTNLSKKADTVAALCALLRGKELLAFAAEEYLQEITHVASKKLFELMDGRYELAYENKDFFVIDNLSGGKKRNASTLSGGETFVVSLSLALAISENILRLSAKPTDFFFLDEGFGSLDNELRETILSSLVKLKESGLVIGLISHVDSLKEEIKTRLEICRTTEKMGGTTNTITFRQDI